MKPRETYKITAVRVVNFHNLGTTTIEIPGGGHLFLLGDNGSGKTTILDAIHYVLSAGEIEFNAAARVAGAKNAGGRKVQGVVMRYNVEAGGPLNRDGGITYAALELSLPESGKVVSICVGLSATGMDVAYDSWAGMADAPVADLPLTVEEGGRSRAAFRDEFAKNVKTLPGGRYFSKIGQYATTVALYHRPRLSRRDPARRRRRRRRSRPRGRRRRWGVQTPTSARCALPPPHTQITTTHEDTARLFRGSECYDFRHFAINGIIIA